MKTIVITPEVQAKGEIDTCNLLLKSNIERLHVRKPFASIESMRDYISALDSQYYHKISLHSHHGLVDEMKLGGKHFKSDQQVVKAKGLVSKSFHSLNELEFETKTLSYGFLSPIFESISKVCYASEFEMDDLKQKLRSFNNFPIYALGGIEMDKIKEVKDLGFSGVALLGTIWLEDKIEKRGEITEAILNA
ncbi:MAG: thiamine phosphate synthase [Reichenbachiella sp.]|uniref:thiamine phosphate synthase n=1 Tax=Reichenbachiella sp. TaxID=2184521 RepID=UPI003298DEAF